MSRVGRLLGVPGGSPPPEPEEKPAPAQEQEAWFWRVTVFFGPKAEEFHWSVEENEHESPEAAELRARGIADILTKKRPDDTMFSCGDVWLRPSSIHAVSCRRKKHYYF